MFKKINNVLYNEKIYYLYLAITLSSFTNSIRFLLGHTIIFDERSLSKAGIELICIILFGWLDFSILMPLLIKLNANSDFTLGQRKKFEINSAINFVLFLGLPIKLFGYSEYPLVNELFRYRITYWILGIMTTYSLLNGGCLLWQKVKEKQNKEKSDLSMDAIEDNISKGFEKIKDNLTKEEKDEFYRLLLYTEKIDNFKFRKILIIIIRGIILGLIAALGEEIWGIAIEVLR